MKKKHKKRSRRRSPIRVPRRPVPGAPPGTMPQAGAEHAVVEVLRYGPDTFWEGIPRTLSSASELRGNAPICWVNVEGVVDPTTIQQLADVFGWHPLVVEDIVSLHQRPKAEDYDQHAYVVVHMPSGGDGLPLEQLSLLFGDSYVVTIQAGIPGDPLDPVRERIRNSRGRIRNAKGDYLAYAIIDAVIDRYFPIVAKLNERLEALESQVGGSLAQAAVDEMHAVRNDLYIVWRTVSSTREAMNRLIRNEVGPVSDETKLYLRDCQDHCAQLLDAVGACRELSSSLMELHQSALNNRMSEGMRILTMIATIFIPMSFIAGVYGMNFERAASPLNMPELGWYFGYPFALVLMLAVGAGFLVFFRRRGWLSRSQ